MNVLVTGTIGYDYIMDFSGKFADRIMPDKIHKISLSFLVDSFSKQFGGTGGNIAYSLQLLNSSPCLLAAAGNDFEPYRKFFEEKQIDTSEIFVANDVVTGSYFVVTDVEDNQIGSFFIGANKYAKDLSIKKTYQKKKIDLAIIAPNDPTAMKKYLEECREINLEYIYDPAFQIESIENEDLVFGIYGAKILIGNDYEISLIEKKLKTSHSKLLKKCSIIVTTLGAKGSTVESGKEKFEIGCARVTEVVDPTGAGDAYRAGFIAGYVRNLSLITCGQMGAVAAAYAVEKYGTVNHSYSVEEFIRRYKENFGEEILLKI